MGGINTKAFEEILDECDNSPQRPRRVLELDPRSPTAEIHRTPIQVEKTPDLESGYDFDLPINTTPVASRSSSATDLSSDPRSPSMGITRTPLHALKETTDPRSPTLGITRTPLYNEKASLADHMEDESFTLDQAEGDVEEDINNVREILNRSLSEPDLTKDYDRLIHAHSGPQSEKKRQSLPAKKNVNKIKRTKPKNLFPLDLKTPPRSPLAAITHDISSPRLLVQRKQVAKLGLGMRKRTSNGTPTKYEIFNDKENVM